MLKNKKNIVRAIIVYVALTMGLWMFLNSYANSYNRLSEEKIAPASLNMSNGKAVLNVLEHSIKLNVTCFSAESRFYFGAYIVSPDELRLTAYLVSFCDNI